MTLLGLPRWILENTEVGEHSEIGEHSKVGENSEVREHYEVGAHSEAGSQGALYLKVGQHFRLERTRLV